MKARILFDEAADTVGIVDLDAAVAAGIVDLDAQQRGFGFGAAVTVDQSTQIGIGETVAIHDQHRIAVQLRDVPCPPLRYHRG